jgi:4-diphosphocytidyl-2-C-methyl-D-erythritol kinase
LISILAPAKVNLTLRVLGHRPDGYHDIESVVQKISLFDRITLTPRKKPGVELSCVATAIPSGPENLAHKAATLLLGAARISNRGISITLDKHIPQGAGLGGGSSDAAAVLMGLTNLFDIPLPHGRLHEIAADIGSDVPLFLYPSPSLITGRGEHVKPAPLRINACFVVVYPEFEVSTAWAYANFRLTKKPRKYRISTLNKVEWEEIAPDRWQDFLVNDLEPAVTMHHPEISRCRNDLVRLGARASLMSGSGSAVFGLFEDLPTARNAVSGLIAEGWRTVFAAVPLFS